MVIVVPRGCASLIAALFLWSMLLLFLFSGPVILAMGIADLIYSTMSIGESIGEIVGGVGLIAIAILYLFYQEKKKDKIGEKYINAFSLGFIALVGIGEIIGGLAQAYDGFHGAARFTWIGGGILTFLPAVIWMIIYMLKDTPSKIEDRKTSAPVAPPKEPNRSSVTKTTSTEIQKTKKQETLESQEVEDIDERNSFQN